jgi:hypothetical protein
MEIPDIPFDALSYTMVVVMFALPAVFPVSLALLWVYLRAVKRSMLRRAAFRPAVLDCHVLTLDVAGFLQTLAERGYTSTGSR